MKVSYRIDDVSDYMNNDNFLKIEALFKKYKIKPLIGVIPKNEDKKLVKFGLVKFDFWNKIRELKVNGWTIAMHGSNHVYETKESGILKYPKKSEFSGLSTNKQRNKIDQQVKQLFRNTNREVVNDKIYTWDKSKKSKTHSINYWFNEGHYAAISCYVFSEEFSGNSHLKVMVNSVDLSDWINSL